MTQETQNLPEIPFEEKARAILSIPEYNMLIAYVEAGKHQLAPETAAKFFELYLTGNSCAEIHRLNKAFPYEAILWARVKFDWDKQKDDAQVDLMSAVREKVIRAQLETTSFMADLLVATSKKHGDKIKKFIQTGNEEDLGDALSVDSLFALLKVADGLMKITGQDKVQKVETKHTQQINVNVGSEAAGAVSVANQGANYIDEKAAADILSVMADAKRRAANARNEKK
jgi:hypothetical protein